MYLLCPGDSWANGAELLDGELPFGYLLAKKLGANYIHTAESATSIPHLILQLKQALKEIEDPNAQIIAAFLLTSPDRDICWSQTIPISLGKMKSHPPPYDEPQVIFLNNHDPHHRDWFRHYHSEELSNYRTNTTLLALQSMCKHYKIKDYYAWAWDKTPLWPEIDISRFYKNGKDDIRDAIDYKSGRHPTYEQHQHICDIFYDMIEPDQSY